MLAVLPLAEIYLRLSCAVAYHNSGQRELAIEHIDKAVHLVVPDGLFVRHFDGLLEERLALVDENAVTIVKELCQHGTSPYEDGCCVDCQYFQWCQDLIGICKNDKNKLREIGCTR